MLLLQMLLLLPMSWLNRQTKHRHNAIHRLVLPTHRATAIRLIVPVAGTGRMQTGSILLHDHRGNNVLVRFLFLGQHREARLHHLTCPIVHLIVLVAIATDCILDGFLDDFTDIVHHKLIFLA